MISSLTTHLCESTLFAALMALLTLCFTNNRAAVRYGLWFAASVKFLVPFSFIIAAGAALRRSAAHPVALDLPWSPTLSNLAVPNVTLPAALPTHFVATAVAPLAAPFMDSGPTGPDFGTVLCALWLAGGAVLLCRWTVQWLRLRAVRKSSVPAEIAANIPVRFSSTLFEPGLVGVFKPILLLPEGIAAQLSPAQLALVIEHELCHWRRRDNLTAAIHMAAQLLFWFHPLLWWIGRRLVTERERACDESVLAAGSNPKAYADSILEVCRFYIRSPLVCAPGVAGANLTHRVEKIMTDATSIPVSYPKFLVLTAVAIGALVLPLASGLLTPSAAAALTPTSVLAPQQPDIAPPPARKIALTPQKAPVRTARRAPVAAPAPEAADAQPAAPQQAAEIIVASVAPATPPQTETPLPVPTVTAPTEEIVVTAKAIRDFVRTRNFVRNYTAPSSFLDQISRWQTPVCVKTQGLAPGYNAFVTARLKQVAAEIGAPAFAAEPCKANLNVVFTNQPQAYVDDIRAHAPALLGVHYPALLKKISTVTHPIQAWYATGTRDSRGTFHFDAYDGFYIPVFVVPGSHLDTGLTSGFATVTIVADINKIEGWEIGTIADYVAMAAFARAKTMDRCQQMPSIANVLDDCAAAVKAKALSDYDVAYLKALYASRDNRPRSLQESEIGSSMLKILEKQVAARKTGVAR